MINGNPSAAPWGGRLVVVGGQSRKVGKTALVVDLIRTFPYLEWTAVKITPHAESSLAKGTNYGPSRDEHRFVIREERASAGSADTCRFLSAGARRAIWLEVREGPMVDALSALAAVLEPAKQVIIESNAVARFWRPDLFLMVLDLRQPDFKRSARNVIELVDAFVCRSPYSDGETEHRLLRGMEKKPKFLQLPGEPLPRGVQILARQRITGSLHPT